MASANLILPNGSKVTIEGTAEEVATLLSELSGQKQAKQAVHKGEADDKRPPRQKQKRESIGPKSLINGLVASNYFKGQRRTIGDIQRKLEEDGHIYALSSLSPALLRLTRDRTLRRIKEKENWVYVN